jgi:serine/threonine-protein kinase HipA
MGRRSHARQLTVWMNGEKTGTWSIGADGVHVFRYDEAWQHSELARPLSLSLPMHPGGTHRGPLVESFFDNLLPDSLSIRKRFQSRFGIASPQAFELLAQIGRDCIGAVQFTSVDEDPGNIKSIQSRPLKDAAIATLLRESVAMPAPGQNEGDTFRISLAGAQEKTALLWHKGKWHQPLGATPSTHIFKLPMGSRIGNEGVDLSTSVDIEWLCRQIVAAFEIPIAACERATFEDQSVLIVERFDRRLASDKSWWMRLPQEDLCQAMGTPLGRKYESDGAPGMEAILKLLLGSREAQADRILFFKAQIVFWMLAAVDGHARNFSVFLGRGGEFQLTPLYDVISVFPIMGRGKNKLSPEKTKMAMSVLGNQGKQYHWDRMRVRHWKSSAAAWGMGAFVDGIVDELIARTPEVNRRIEAELPGDFPAAIAEPILKGLRSSAAKMTNEGF